MRPEKLLMDSPAGKPDALNESAVPVFVLACTWRPTARPSVLFWVLGVVTARCGADVITQRPAALLHRLCIANVPVESLTSPAGSLPPQMEPRQAHLSPISPGA